MMSERSGEKHVPMRVGLAALAMAEYFQDVSTQGRDSSEWSCHEEERSKWLRIVDVKHEEGQVAPSVMSEDGIAVTTDDTGYGRLNRRPRTDHDGWRTSSTEGEKKNGASWLADGLGLACPRCSRC